jgi:hypothetical protein
MKRRLLALVALCFGFLTVATTAANASDDPGFGDNSGLGIPGWFIGLFVLAVILSIGITIWRVTMARSIARQAGLNPNTATAVTLLGNDGLDAAYLAANLRNPPAASTSGVPATPRTTEERLAELQRLKDQGLVTDEEYVAHRKAILGSV